MVWRRNRRSTSGNAITPSSFAKIAQNRINNGGFKVKWRRLFDEVEVLKRF